MMRHLKTLPVAGIFVLGFAAAMSAPAHAGTASSNLGVSATVSANCTVSTTAVAFGSVDTLAGTNIDADGGISVTCTNGTSWSASAGNGTGTGATVSSRKMKSGSNLLSYTLYTNESRTSIWGDGSSGSVQISNSGTGGAQSVAIYGRIFAGQTGVPAGSYADTVAVTITY